MRVDDEITRLVIVSHNVFVALDVGQKAGSDGDLDDAVQSRNAPR